MHCTRLIEEKISQAKVLLSAFVEVAAADLHCANFSPSDLLQFLQTSSPSQTTPPSLSFDSLQFFDEEVRHCFSSCLAVDILDVHWQQGQLNVSFGGLGFRSLSHHCCAAFISSLSLSGIGSTSNKHLVNAISRFNTLVSPSDVITIDAILFSPSQQALSKKLDSHLFNSILRTSSPANKACLLSSSAPYASSWLSVVPSVGLGLHLDSPEFHTAVKWWLGMNSSARSSCPFCPDITLDPLSHHAVSCRQGGDVVIRHNHLRNIIVDLCHRAHLSVRVEVGRGLLGSHNYSRPADVLVGLSQLLVMSP